MCNQLTWNIMSLLIYGLICGSIIYLPSERSFCCNTNEWRLLFLWLEVSLLLICFFYIIFCLVMLRRNENAKRLEVLLSSKVLFELIILSLFLLCTISNTSILGGIDINDRNKFPGSLVPSMIIRSLRVLVAALITLWIFVYDLNYLPLEGNYAKFLPLRRCLHGFLMSTMLCQAVRFGIMVFFWPSVMTNILEKTDRDELYFSITLPVSNMFWLRCFFKLWQTEPAGTPHQEPTNLPVNVGDEIVERLQTVIMKQMNIRLGFTLVTALSLVGIMYAVQLLDKTDHVYTGCSYGLFRIGLSALFIFMIIVATVKRWEGTIAVVSIHFHGVEMFQLVLFFLAKILINILNGIWFSSGEHHEGFCMVPGISVTAQGIDGVFNVLQFLCLLRVSRGHWLLRSSLFYLLIGINCGLIWFDLSAEALHLKHFTDDYDHLNKQWVFLLIQAIFWMGLEYYILVVELLVMQRLDTPLQIRVFQKHPRAQFKIPSKNQFHTIPPNFFSQQRTDATINTVYEPVLVRSNSSTHLLA